MRSAASHDVKTLRYNRGRTNAFPAIASIDGYAS
jgi:hypothetical protein